MKKTITIIFCNKIKNMERDIEVPLDITANELFYALNSAYHLCKEDTLSSTNYLKCENPIILIKGNKTLREYGLYDGSVVLYP